MLILGLDKRGDEVHYSVVENGQKVLKKGKIELPSVDLLQAISSDSGVEAHDFKAIALHDHDDLELLTQLPVFKFNKKHSDLHSHWIVDVGHEIDTEDVKYPLVIWHDDREESSINLVTGFDQFRTVSQPTQSVNAFVTSLAEELGVANLFQEARKGDPYFKPFKAITEVQKDFDLSYLKDELSDAISDFKSIQDRSLSIELQKELESYWKQDISASLQEAIFETIIYQLFNAGVDLGVDTFGAVGDMVYVERFLELLTRRAAENNFKVRIPLIDIHSDRASSAAGLAYQKLQ